MPLDRHPFFHCHGFDGPARIFVGIANPAFDALFNLMKDDVLGDYDLSCTDSKGKRTECAVSRSV